MADLHLAPPIAAALEALGWAPQDPAVREAAPTAARGHNLVVAAPPVAAYAAPALAGLLSRLGEGRRGLLLCPAEELGEWARLAHTLAGGSGRAVLAAPGTARASRRLRDGGVDLLVAAPETALALVRRSALKPEGLAAVLLAWPELWADEETLAPLMQDLPKESQRVICTAAPERAAPLVERYARRALTLGAPPPDEVAPPLGPVRVASVPWHRRTAALADLVELLDPTTLVVWTADRGRHADIAGAVSLAEPGARVVTGDVPAAQVVVAYDLPTRDRLAQLLAAGEVVLLVPPSAEGYAARIAAPRRPVRLPGLLDSVTTAAGARRAAIARAMEEHAPERALLVLAPLFERYDPAAVAAALYELWTAARAGAPTAAAPGPVPDIPATSRIYVGVGRRDGATVADLVAVLTKEVRVAREQIGKVELRDAFALVELPAQEAERVASALNGTTIRRKRVTARVDRGAPGAARRRGSPAR